LERRPVGAVGCLGDGLAGLPRVAVVCGVRHLVPTGHGDLGSGPFQRRAQILDVDLVDGALLSLRSLVLTLLEAAGHDDPGALGEGFGGVVGQVPPGRAAKEQRVAVLPLAGRLVIEAATVNAATAVPVPVNRSSGFVVRFPVMVKVVSPDDMGGSVSCSR